MEHRQRLHSLPNFIRLAAALIAAFFITQIKLDFVEYYIFDLLQRIKPASVVSENIHLILVDQNSIEQLKSRPHFKEYNQLLRSLKDDQARYILLNLRLDEIEGTAAEKEEFAQLTREIPNTILISNELELRGEEPKNKLPAPLDKIPTMSGPKTSDIKIFAKDSVTRRMLVNYQDQPLLHYVIAKEFNPELNDIKKIVGAFDFFGSAQVYIDFHPTGTYPRTNFSQFLDQPDSLNFKDKVVIIGPDDQTTSKDYIMTPFSRELLAMTTTEMHANMIDTLIKNKSVKTSADWLDFILTALVCFFTVNIILTLRPLMGIGLLGLLAGLLALSSFVSLWPFGVWVKLAHPLLAIFLCYYFFIPYRLIMENRKSWEYFQKNQLLSQVEELKTNFISMMSHDLKTPIARIQGMSEAILKDANPLSSQQRESLDSIRASSDDLLKFINAILQYGRIESAGVQLHLQSRDINSVVKDIVKKHEFLAKLKKIHVRTELEPLFPIQVDPELIGQVFSNLIENAIKYSPEGSSVLISSEEREGKIVIQVADQGQGIPADELPNVFMKFFRSKNAKSSPIKGSGLGLYLAKYFTELHGGTLTVESTYGQGSTFTVELSEIQGAGYENTRS